MATDTPAQIEEVRYVAMTRGKDDLHLSLPQRFVTHQQPSSGDRHGFASRTRFIPAAILDRFTCAPGDQRASRSQDTYAWHVGLIQPPETP
jgi:superfamily I DNA/RNA helicase